MSQKEELRQRAEAKKAQLEADLKQMRADATGKTNENITKIENKIDELSTNLKKFSDDASESIAKKINNLLK